ncbi:MAG: hypothetical protein A2580_18140 [Hydrogenophilales bacterium RIFOXYD1_FULL_62_11]|nr:MAG: hypothetical protein A2580_18140 [Hydrogenophilales bacterium RIFOXYD1_FULL_62_11]
MTELSTKDRLALEKVRATQWQSAHDRLAEQLKASNALLEEVRQVYTHDDDMPDRLLPRIDEHLANGPD